MSAVFAALAVVIAAQAPTAPPTTEAARLASEAKQLAAKGGRDSLKSAIDRLAEARAIWRDLGVRQSELEVLNTASELFYALSDYAASASHAREAIVLADAMDDRKRGIEARNTLGLSLWRVGEVSDALEVMQQAIALQRQAGLRTSEAAALYSNTGLLLQEVGQADDARQHFAQALTIALAVGDRKGQGIILHNRAAAGEQLGLRKESLVDIRQAVSLLRASGDRLAEGRARLVQSHVEWQLGAARDARTHAARALTLIRQAANRAAEADALRLLGRITVSTPAESAAYYEQALALYRDLGSRRGEADVLHLLGVTALAAADHARAAELLTRALDLRRAIGIKPLAADTLVQLAEAERALGDLDRARAHLEDALSLVEDLRAGLFEREMRLSYLDANHDYYSRYLDLLVARARRHASDASGAALAFEAAERIRAAELLRALRTKWSASVPPEHAGLVNQEQSLRRRLNHASWQLFQLSARPESPARERELRSAIERLLLEYRDLEATIARAMPEYSALLRPEHVPLATVQRELAADALLLQYTLGEARSYVIAVTRDTVAIFDLPKRRDLESRARAFHRMLASGDADAAERARREQEARRLGSVLLKPVRALLAQRRLTIVADGALQFVPFGALIDTGQPLVHTHDIVSAPSIAALLWLRRETANRKPAAKTLAIFADPVFDPGDVRVRARRTPRAAAAPLPLTRRLTRLPFSRDEADQIAATAPAGATRKALDFDANRALATSRELADFRVVHFATHALQDSDHPELSGIILSLVDPAGAPRDGFLRLHDLYTLRLNAELAVLSACDTAVSRGRHGLASLANGFFAAGVPRVVSTLWKVPDESAAALMASFYRLYLGEGRDPAGALAAAQRAMAKARGFRDPTWAAFVLQGIW